MNTNLISIPSYAIKELLMASKALQLPQSLQKVGLVRGFAKKLLFGLAFAVASPVMASNFDISIGVAGEVAPGVYGRVNVSNERYPALIYSQPVVVERVRRYYDPVYLHVPPGHARRWERYCDHYGACARPVYFVRSPEYYGWGGQRRAPEQWAYREGYRDGRRDEDRWDRWERRERKHWRHEDRHRERFEDGRHRWRYED